MVRVAALWGMPLRIATAAIIVDVTIGVVTRVIFVVLMGTLAAAGFYAVQRMGIFRWSATLAARLAKVPGGDSLEQGGEALDQ